MRRRSRTLGIALSCASVVLVVSGCEADPVDDAGVTPIEEPSSVTDTTDEPEQTGDAAPDETTAGEPDGPDESSDDDAPSTTAAVFVTTPPAKTSPPVSRPPGEPSTETVYEVGMIDVGLTPFVDRATADLAARLDVAPESIEVLTAVLVTWPDASLGCPEPDRVYATVLTDGSVIELGAGGLVYRYHSGGERSPFPCDLPLDPVPTPTVGRSS